jgi:hypothetical protein
MNRREIKIKYVNGRRREKIKYEITTGLLSR